MLDHPLVALLYKNIASVTHLHRKLKIFGTTWFQFLKLKVFNTMMHTITGNQINLFLYKWISDMCTVMFKELSVYDISCIIWCFHSSEDSSFGLLSWDHVMWLPMFLMNMLPPYSSRRWMQCVLLKHTGNHLHMVSQNKPLIVTSMVYSTWFHSSFGI